MLAALFGQVAFDSGASYEALFYVSFVSVGAGCVVGCFLPSAPFDEGPGLSLRYTRTPSTGRTFRDELTRFTKAIRDTVTLVSVEVLRQWGDVRAERVVGACRRRRPRF